MAGNEPAINLFLPNKPVLEAHEHQQASVKLRTLATLRPDEFAALAGMPLDEAKDTAHMLLDQIEEEDRKQGEQMKSAA